MFVRFLRNSLRRISSVIGSVVKRVFSDFPLLLSVFTVFILVFCRNLSGEALVGLKGISISLVILSFTILVIVISAIKDLENGKALGENRGWSVSQFITNLPTALLVSFILSLQLLFCIVILQSNNSSHLAKEVSVSSFTNETVQIKVLVSDEPIEYFEYYLTRGTILQGERFDMQFKLPKASNVEIGDVCSLKGRFYKPEPFDGFDYASYLASKGIYRLMRVNDFNCEKSVSESTVFNFKAGLIKFKGRLIEDIERNLPEPQASLLAGIVFGQKRVFSAGFDRAVKGVGVSHVVAASGYNISFVVTLANRLFGFLGRRSKVVVGILFVCIYCILSGLSPSILRAGLMYSLSGLFVILGVHFPILNVLIITLALFLLVDPLIITDVGFQLSFASTVALMYISPILEKFFKKVGVKVSQNSVFVPTLACTLGTLPITIYTFKTFPVFSVLVNTIVLPFIDTSLLLGVSALALGNLAGGIGKVVYIIIWIQLKFFELIVLFFGSIPWSVIDLKGFG